MSDYKQPQDDYTHPAYYTETPANETSSEEPAEGEQRKRGVGWLATLGGLLAALSQIKFVGFALQFLGTGLTAFASIFVYSFSLGWPFAIGLVLLIFVHEMGHAIMMWIKRIPIKGMVFIPFLGAATVMKRLPENVRDAAEVGLAGPIAGAAGATVCYLVALSPTSPPVWSMLAYFGFLLNLLNLFPVMPFDGGMIVAAIDRRIWVLGFLGLLGWQIWQWINGQASFFLLVIVVLAAFQLYAIGFTVRDDSPEGRAYYAIPGRARLMITILYFLLVATLYFALYVMQMTLYVPGIF